MVISQAARAGAEFLAQVWISPQEDCIHTWY